jgi:hypothetical protein
VLATYISMYYPVYRFPAEVIVGLLFKTPAYDVTISLFIGWDIKMPL